MMNPLMAETAAFAMLDFTPQKFIGLLVFFPLIALSLTVHEFWHAYSAELMGDRTAKLQGRCTLNPLAHLDPIGTIALLFAPVGWARPVPVNPLNFKNPSRGMFISVAAGPLSNLGIAVICGIILRILAASGYHPIAGPDPDGGVPFSVWLYGALGSLLLMNVSLFLFNLIPLFPLDGHHLLRELLSGETKRKFIETQRYGIFVLIGLLVAGHDILNVILYRPAWKLVHLLMGLDALMPAASAQIILRDYLPW